MHINHLQKNEAFFLSGCVYMNGLQNYFKTLALIPTVTSPDPVGVRTDNHAMAWGDPKMLITENMEKFKTF